MRIPLPTLTTTGHRSADIVRLVIWMHLLRPGELAADHSEPLVLGGEPLPAVPGVLCSGCNARKGLSQRRR